MKILIGTSDSEDEYQEAEETAGLNMTCKTCKNCACCCLKLLVKYNLYGNAYTNLSLAYNYFLTLPVTQVACERPDTLFIIKSGLDQLVCMDVASSQSTDLTRRLGAG